MTCAKNATTGFHGKCALFTSKCTACEKVALLPDAPDKWHADLTGVETRLATIP